MRVIQIFPALCSYVLLYAVLCVLLPEVFVSCNTLLRFIFIFYCCVVTVCRSVVVYVFCLYVTVSIYDSIFTKQ